MHRYKRIQAGGCSFPCPPGMPHVLHELLIARGISSAEEAQCFLHPSADQLRDPMLLNDMTLAVEVLRSAVAAGERICVYGDYDVDGITATSILTTYLRSVGADVHPYIPSRHSEGYGMNPATVRRIAEEGTKLIVTVDCGVTNLEEVALALQLGMRVVVTDHHTPGEQLPDCPVVDPHLGGYPFRGLCGGALAFKLVWALAGRETALEYVDLAALATVADVMPLRDESRVIAALGLEALSARGVRPGIAALKSNAGYKDGERVTSEGVAFRLGPRINSAGRLGSAMRGFRLLTAATREAAQPIADELEEENVERKRIEHELMQEAEAQLTDYDFRNRRAIILLGRGWNTGIIGLAAGRLCERYHCPTIVLSDDGERITGSCRSIEGVDIHAALCSCADLFERFGGHKQAAGLSLKRGCYDEFVERLNAWLKQNTADVLYVPEDVYDMELVPRELTTELVESLAALEPTGEGNSKPIFRAHVEVLGETALSGGKHLKLQLGGDGSCLDGLMWNRGDLKGHLPRRLDVLFRPSINEFRGTRSVQMMLDALRPEGPEMQLAVKKGEAESLFQSFLTEVFYNRESSFFPDERPGGTVLSVGELARQLTGSAYGTLVSAGSPEAAERLISELRRVPERMGDPEFSMPDITFGRACPDPRGFNTIWVLPSAPIPQSFSRVVCLDMPCAVRTPADTEILRAGTSPAWVSDIPDVNGLREVFKAAAALTGQPLIGTDMLLGALSERSGVTRTGCVPALCALTDMGLVTIDRGYDGEPIGVKAVRGKRSRPEDSAVWRTLQRWRGED